MDKSSQYIHKIPKSFNRVRNAVAALLKATRSIKVKTPISNAYYKLIGSKVGGMPVPFTDGYLPVTLGNKVDAAYGAMATKMVREPHLIPFVVGANIVPTPGATEIVIGVNEIGKKLYSMGKNLR